MVRLTFLAALCLITRVCLACDCVNKPTCGGLHDGAAFFVGTPVSRRIVHEPNDPRFESAVYSVHVTEVLSPNAPKSMMVKVRTGIGGGDCGWDFHLGTSYLLETRPSSSGTISTSLCSWTNEVSLSQVLLRQLRTSRDGGKQDSLTGQILQRQLSRDPVTGRVIQKEIFPGWKYPLFNDKPLSSITLAARHGQKTYSASSDKEGVFSFPLLPPGDYVLAPSLPVSLKLYRGENIGRDFSRVTIPEAMGDKPFCRAFLEGQPAGGVTGRVVAQPSVVQRITVSALLIEGQDKIEIKSDIPNSDGTFLLGSLPPGPYQIVATTGAGPHRRQHLSGYVTVAENGLSDVFLTGKSGKQIPAR